MKNYGVLGGCYLPRPMALTDNTLLDLHNSSKDTQPHSLTVNYCSPEETLFLSFAGAHWQMTTTLYQNRPEEM